MKRKKKRDSVMGCPRIEIDFEQMKKLCEMQATLLEIAAFFRCSDDTIENRVKEEYGITFSEYFKKHSAGGKISLRRSQFNAAIAGSVPMMIWLGKQHLGQSEKQSIDLNDITNRKFNINFTNPDPKVDD